MKSLEAHFTEYQRDGYTIFKQYLAPDQLSALRQQLDPIMAQANQDQNRRVMRLFGQDDSVQARQQKAWQQMIAEERAG